MPKVYISCKAYLSNINLDYTTLLVYTEIFFKIINKELSELIYLGDSSDHSVNISLTVSSMIIKIEGYTDSIGNYINEYFNQFSKLIDITKIEGINNKILTFLEKMIQKYNNSLIGDVREQTELRLNKILREVYTKNKLEIMQKIKDELLKNDMIPNKFLFFLKNIFKKMKFEWFVEGNIFLKDAEKIIKKVESELNKWSINGENENKKNKECLSINEIRKQRIVHLPDNKIYRYNFSSKDKENESSTILIYFQIDNFNYNNNNIFNNNAYNEYIKNRSCLYIIHSIFYELFYDELRTDQQVGYDVDFVENNEWYILGLYFFVSSSKYNPDEIVEKINNFIIDNDINDPENFTDEDYESYKKSVINDLSQKPLTLEEEYTRDFSFISKRIYIFSLRQDMINYIKNNINKQMIIDFFNKYIYKKAKRLEIALYCSKKKEEKKEEKMEIEEKDEEKEEDEKEEDENDDNNDDILPSYKDIKIEIINDIDDFHRNINYYDNEFY
jgi:secreted Zn-dependent insulinase-like peptidase